MKNYKRLRIIVNQFVWKCTIVKNMVLIAICKEDLKPLRKSII